MFVASDFAGLPTYHRPVTSREVISVGVIYRSPSGDTAEGRTHDECAAAIRGMGLDPADCTVELTEITDEVNRWPGITTSRYGAFCEWA